MVPTPAARRSASRLTFEDAILFPGNGFTTGQLLDYYVRISPYLLPHLKGRPVTLKRYPGGVRGEAFWEKDVPSYAPDFIRTIAVPRKMKAGDIHYIVINDVRTLAWCASIATVEFHPFLHKAAALQRPTHLVFDLDPGEGADLLECVEVAFILRDWLKKRKLTAFPKVSGSKGIQLHIPLNTPATYDATKAFAHYAAEELERAHPAMIVSGMSKELRVGKVFIDWSQNIDSKTTVGVYSVRAKRDRPYVSVPVKWEEMKRAQRAADKLLLFFTPDDTLSRVEKLGDLFAPVLTLKQKLPAKVKAPKGGGVAKGRGVAGAAGEARAGRRLTEYAEKRNFAKTREPAPTVVQRSRQGGRRRFVVQMHAASHLHFDFRLEMHDVLKSWAVPKGVPLKPEEKRSAFATEDHPLAYLDFEGTIPSSQYGGGTVMVWDIGTYELIEGNYYRGRMRVQLSGRKLKGEWMLEKQESEDGEKQVWLLKRMGTQGKVKAETAARSAVSGRTMEEIKADKGAVWQNNRK